MGTELAPDTDGVVEEWRGGSWEELTAGADEHFGADLEKGDSLIGIPFCLIRATYRLGDYKTAKTGDKRFYVSLDAVIGRELDLRRAVRRGRATEEAASAFDPYEHIVFNEGGTGVYRQVTQYLCERGLVRIESGLPEEGAYGESRFDISPAQWEVSPAADFKKDDDGTPTVAFDIRLLCARGLRASEYVNEEGPARTRYIA